MVVWDYNPTRVFWAHENYATRENCISIHSTYKDNCFLSAEQVAEIESNKDDANWWRVYGEGKIGQLDGVVYTFDQIDALPEGVEASSLKECYGIDFGFTNDPTSIVHVFADTGRKHLYIDEVAFKRGMTNAAIADALRLADVPPTAEIFADCAEPKSIAEIQQEGFNVQACDKDAPTRSDKLKFQILWMQGWKFFVTKRSLNIINELRNYTWAKDKDGNQLNQPIDKFNHSLDALRYAVWTKFGKNANKGNYNVSIR